MTGSTSGVSILLLAVFAVALLAALALGYWLGKRGQPPAAGPSELTAAVQPVLSAAVQPVSESLTSMARRIEDLEQRRVAEQSELATALTEQMRAVVRSTAEVRNDTGALQAALGRSSVRGSWGEASLRRTVEACGMLNRVHFTEQDHSGGSDDGKRPDMVIHLGQGRSVVVDAKVPMEAALAAQAQDDPAARAEAMRLHAAAVSRHIDALSKKEYYRGYESCEFVVAFLPSESLLADALSVDPSLLDRAFSKNVVPATPATLYVLLRAIEMGWRQEALAAEAQEIASAGGELHRRLLTMAKHLDKVGVGLTNASKAYNDYIGSLEARVLPAARRMSELSKHGDAISVAGPVDVAIRAVDQTHDPIAAGGAHASDAAALDDDQFDTGARDTGARDEEPLGAVVA